MSVSLDCLETAPYTLMAESPNPIEAEQDKKDKSDKKDKKDMGQSENTGRRGSYPAPRAALVFLPVVLSVPSVPYVLCSLIPALRAANPEATP